jgi:hypothetical protein
VACSLKKSFTWEQRKKITTMNLLKSDFIWVWWHMPIIRTQEAEEGGSRK